MANPLGGYTGNIADPIGPIYLNWYNIVPIALPWTNNAGTVLPWYS